MSTAMRALAALALGLTLAAAGCASEPPGDETDGGCPTGRSPCGGECVDPQTDVLHCGACGRPCSAEQVCAGGLCVSMAPCSLGMTCGGACVDPRTDPRNCGACGAACADGEVCVAGACGPCSRDRRTCGDAVCRDLTSDTRNCGACGTACSAEQRCEGGRCVCPLGYGACGGSDCHDLSFDPNHCGACGHACSSGVPCDRGVCGCGPGQARCADAVCHDLLSDSYNCGACSSRCPRDAFCADGRCVCRSGSSMCGDAVCHDLMSDTRNCGACDRTCDLGQFCEGGRCGSCGSGSADCDGDSATRCETETVSNDAHCGACEVACASGAACVDGRCELRPFSGRSPISTMTVTSARPTLWWWPPTGAEGAHVEVCTSRACDHVEQRSDVVGDHWRVATALTPGVHFWRVFARSGGSMDATASTSWEFVVPGHERGAAESNLARRDVNGDGLEDRLVARIEGTAPATRAMLDVFFGGRSSTAPDQTILVFQSWYTVEGSDSSAGRVTAPIPVAIGDVNGDGYGDVLVRERVEFQVSDTGHYGSGTQEDHLVFAGGPTGLNAGPLDTISFGYEGAGLGGSATPTIDAVFPVGDLDGDGLGDWYTRTAPGRGVDRFEDNVFFGSRGSFSGEVAQLYGDLDLPDLGDFNDDGLSDLIRHEQTPMPVDSVAELALGGSAWRSSRRYFFTEERLRPCGSASSLVTYGLGTLSVIDQDDDGLDDLRANVMLESGPTTLLYRGGPGGLVTGRCMALP